MFNKIKHGGLALLVFIAMTGAFFWMSGTFSLGKAGAADKDEHGHEGHARGAVAPGAAAPGKPKTDDCCPNDGEKSPAKPAEKDEHGHEGHAHDKGEAETAKPLTIAEIEKKECEHKIQQLACDECRYELGVVKVKPLVTGALVATAKAEQREVVQKLRVTGEVQFDQTRVVDVVPVATGRITTIKAHLGQQVKQGDTLAVVHSSEFGEAKAAFLDASTSFEIAGKELSRQVAINAALEKLLEHLSKTRNGGSLEFSGEAFNGLKQPLGEWRSKLVGAAARLQKARVAHDREKGLVEKQASSKSDYEDALRELQTAQAELDALVEEVQLSLNLTKLKVENGARQTEAKMNAAEQRLHLFGLDDAAIKAIGHVKENGSFAQLEIKSPRAGTITAQAVAEGRYVDTTHSMFTIADVSNVWVWCDVYERDLAALHEKLARDNSAKAIVSVPAFANATFAGVVDLVASSLDEHTRTVKVRVQLANPQGKLKPGMFATVEIELPAARVATMLPRNAVLSDEGKSFAFEHWRDDLWLKRDVTVGSFQDEMVEVSGVKPGATIATSGAFLFKSDVLRAKMGAGCAD